MHRWCGTCLVVLCAGPLHADVFKCVSPNGDVLFTNDRVEAKQKACTQITVTPVVIPSPAAPGKSPAQAGRPGSSEGFPKVAPQVQQQRDNDRRKILETELASEEKLLQAARRDLAEQEGTRSGGERNYARVLERLEPYQKKVKTHEENVAALQKELANLR